MLLDDLKENDIIVFSDGSCNRVTSCAKNEPANIISIVFIEKVSGRRGYPKKFCWTYSLDGKLCWSYGLDTNNVVKVIHVREGETR